MLFRGSNMLSCTYFCLYLSQYRPQSSEKFTPVLLSVGNTFGPHTCPACYKGWGEIGGCFCLGHTAFRGRSEASLSLSHTNCRNAARGAQSYSYYPANIKKGGALTRMQGRKAKQSSKQLLSTPPSCSIHGSAATLLWAQL